MAKKKKMSKVSKRRLVVLGPLCIFAFVYLAFCLTSSVIKIYNLHQEKINLENELTTLKEEEEELKIEIDRLKDPDYLARYARENYLYSKDGEYVIKIDEKKKELDKVNKQIRLSDDLILMVLGGLLLIIFIIVLRRRKHKKK